MPVEIDESLSAQFRSLSSNDERVDILFDYMLRRGQSNYDESVTQLEHALQAAFLAKRSGAEPVVIVAALLHDIGHFLTDEHSEHSDFTSEDWLHEEIGADCLGEFFHPAVIETMRLHVDAKRYLCGVDPLYREGLSPASENSLRLQGGPMTSAETEAFESRPFAKVAIQVRHWDDQAKVAGMEVPDLESYRDAVLQSFV